MCMNMNKKTGWHHYVGDKKTMDDTEQHAQYISWVSGKQSNVMIATSAFSTGNDYPHLHLVLHLDKSFEMLDYVQGQGGAGCDGAIALCYTLVPTKPWKESTKENAVEKDNGQAIINHLHLHIWQQVMLDVHHQSQDIQIAAISWAKKTLMAQSETHGLSMSTTFTDATHQAKALKANRELKSIDAVQ
ncbi:hypothetical protein JVT61DRAFT_7240 [Boletus reticuloceps]|uniref:Helicase C-terminal domain-containing protein n=1 Tax=Boletus reticuloceps TaxID=495285 RepID=A0A8I2YJJ9_9AGAM|nr:hypothetical protein JVT61DRAFT_7240 [Boletus reticuloceps]